jgi:hypothetical protein
MVKEFMKLFVRTYLGSWFCRIAVVLFVLVVVASANGVPLLYPFTVFVLGVSILGVFFGRQPKEPTT